MHKLVILVGLFCSLGQAQEIVSSVQNPVDSASELRLVPFLGASTFTLSTNGRKSEQRLSPAGALMLNVGRKALIYEAGLAFVQTGAKENLTFAVPNSLSSTQNINGTYELKMDYLAVPVLAKLRLGNKAIKPFFKLGAVPMYLLSVEEKTRRDSYNYVIPNAFGTDPSTFSATSPASETISTDKSAFNNFLLYGQAGLGIEANITETTSLIVEGNYSRNITKIKSDDVNRVSEGISLIAGLAFFID